jgi:hypothetical protein
MNTCLYGAAQPRRLVGASTRSTRLRHLPGDGSRAVRRVDVLGIVTLSLTLLLIVLPLVLGRTEGWPTWAWICLAAGVTAFGLFLRVERRTQLRHCSPLVNLQGIARPPVAWRLLTLLVATGTYYALLFRLAQ